LPLPFLLLHNNCNSNNKDMGRMPMLQFFSHPGEILPPGVDFRPAQQLHRQPLGQAHAADALIVPV
jgi:hypothetical protein